MKELQDLRPVIITRIELEEEATALEAKLPSDRRELERLTRIAQTNQDEVEKIQGSSLRGFFLRLTGRREEQLEQAQRQAAKASVEMNAARFLLDTTEGRIQAIEKSLLETEEDEMRFQQAIEEQFPNDGAFAAVRIEVEQLKKAFVLREKIREEMTVLLQLVEQAIGTCTHGDIQTSATGTRYNRRSHTLKEHCQRAEEQLAVFCATISDYNILVPEDLHDELESPWTGNKAYLTEPLSDLELMGRLVGLQDWTQRLKRGWTKSTPILKSHQRQANNKLRYLLLSLHDQLS